MESYNSLSKNEQLKKVNIYLNKLQGQYDDVLTNKEDNWATPKEFLKIGYGDCEDYVFIKYYSLIKLGFDEKKLFITIVKEKFYGGHHMVLSYFQKKGKAPLILDNLSFKILDLKTRVDLEAEHFINSSGVYKIDANFKLIKVAQKYKEFEELKLKVEKNL
jgi:predicted transglutaminase-like cysteine proteinase